MMTLDEAIAHAKEKAKELSDKAYAEYGKTMTEEQAYECNECAREHEQLAAWLTELQERREAETKLKPTSELINDIIGFDVGKIEPLPEYKESEGEV